MNLAPLIRFYNEFSPRSIDRLAEFYSAEAGFKDPFNEVRGVAAIERIFRHMFRQLAEPRFVVIETVADEGGAVLVWEFHFRFRGWNKCQAQIIRGVSHLKFDADGKIVFHRDYWDAAEELYMKLPVLGVLMRGLRRAMTE